MFHVVLKVNFIPTSATIDQAGDWFGTNQDESVVQIAPNHMFNASLKNKRVLLVFVDSYSICTSTNVNKRVLHLLDILSHAQHRSRLVYSTLCVVLCVKVLNAAIGLLTDGFKLVRCFKQVPRLAGRVVGQVHGVVAEHTVLVLARLPLRTVLELFMLKYLTCLP